MTEFTPRKGMSDDAIAETVSANLAEATLEEKVAMMSGRGFFQAMTEDRMRWGARRYRAGAGCERLGVPAFWFTDGPRGVARGNSMSWSGSKANRLSLSLNNGAEFKSKAILTWATTTRTSGITSIRASCSRMAFVSLSTAACGMSY